MFLLPVKRSGFFYGDRPRKLGLTSPDLSLLTDLYQLTMAACYVGEGMADRPASFELFVRRLPKHYGYLIAMGIHEVVAYLTAIQFTPAQIAQLQQLSVFSQAPTAFWQRLETFQFTGDVWCVLPGTAVFPNEPLLRIEAPLWQAQLVETCLLNIVNYQTLIATRAARLRDTAGENKTLLEFGTRRAFSPQGAVWAARAALAGGLDGTSNVLAALQLGLAPQGTMAHALVMAIKAIAGEEDEAFSAFQRYFPQAPLLVDTFDTSQTVQRLARQVTAGRRQMTGVRLDSGDLVSLSQQVRQQLPDVNIFASGDLDEWAIARLNQQGAEIDGYGLGTKLVTGEPVNGVYKLVEMDGRPTCKRSRNKATYGGKKQIFRRCDPGQWLQDRLGLADESPHAHETPLLQLIMRRGQACLSDFDLNQIRQRTRQSVLALPPEIRSISGHHPDPVVISEALQTRQQQIA